MKKVIFSFILALTSFVAAASPELDANQIRNALKTQVDGMVKLPVVGLTMIEANGKMFLVSDNGRIVVTGRVYDMWNTVELKNVEDAEKFAYKIDVEKLGLKVEELGAINIGAGKKEVIIFLDPDCATCHKLIQSALKQTEYTFKIVMIPLLGEDSFTKIKKATCTADKAAVAKAMIDNAWDKLPKAPADCVVLPMQKAIMTARVFGIQSVPYMIRNDGKVAVGFTKDLAEWLEEAKDKQGADAAKAVKGKKPNTPEVAKQK